MLDNKARVEQLREQDYQGLFGVKKAVFDGMLEVL
jgi:hypothetical protein